MYLSGYKVLQAYNTGIKHLDARSGVRVDISKKMYYQKKLLFVLWYRSIYNLKRNSPKNKFLCISAYIYRTVLGIFSLFVDTIRYKKPRFIIDYFIAIKDGYNYVHSTEYMKIPLFDEFSQK